VVKNKIAPPFKQAEFQILYGQGFNRMGEIIDLGVKVGIVEKAGAWFSYNGSKLGQGKSNSSTFLKENPDIANEIEGIIRDKLLPKNLIEEEEQS
jgi:recombination protein RecA